MNAPGPSSGRFLALLLSVALSLALVGFFTGTRSAPQHTGYHATEDQRERELPPAPKHRDMELTRYAERGRAQLVALAALRIPMRDAGGELVRDAHSYAAEVAARAEGRAYDGAPPTIPHAVDQRGAPGCPSCHSEGLRVPGKLGDKIAKPISHPPYASCLQCHTTRAGGPPNSLSHDVSAEVESTFEGMRSPGRGARAYPGAPPQMPHRSFMRERCASCHGVWATGLATSHPWRQSCRQCHTPAATADQLPSSPLLALPAWQEAP